MVENKKIAILGYGHIGIKHAEMIALAEGCHLVALINPKFTTQSVPYLPNVSTFYSLEEFLAGPLTADIVAICTPNGLHFSPAKLLIENSIHIIIKKPVKLKSCEATELEKLAAEKNVHIFPVMQNRLSPRAAWLKSIMNVKVLGKINIVLVSCFYNRSQYYYAKGSWRGNKYLDGGTLYRQFSYYFDIMHWLFGDISNIKSKFADFNHTDLTELENNGIITFDFVSDGI